MRPSQHLVPMALALGLALTWNLPAFSAEQEGDSAAEDGLPPAPGSLSAPYSVAEEEVTPPQQADLLGTGILLTVALAKAHDTDPHPTDLTVSKGGKVLARYSVAVPKQDGELQDNWGPQLTGFRIVHVLPGKADQVLLKGTHIKDEFRYFCVLSLAKDRLLPDFEGSGRAALFTSKTSPEAALLVRPGALERGQCDELVGVIPGTHKLAYRSEAYPVHYRKTLAKLVARLGSDPLGRYQKELEDLDREIALFSQARKLDELKQAALERKREARRQLADTLGKLDKHKDAYAHINDRLTTQTLLCYERLGDFRTEAEVAEKAFHPPAEHADGLPEAPGFFSSWPADLAPTWKSLAEVPTGAALYAQFQDQFPELIFHRNNGYSRPGMDRDKVKAYRFYLADWASAPLAYARVVEYVETKLEPAQKAAFEQGVLNAEARAKALRGKFYDFGDEPRNFISLEEACGNLDSQQVLDAIGAHFGFTTKQPKIWSQLKDEFQKASDYAKRQRLKELKAKKSFLSDDYKSPEYKAFQRAKARCSFLSEQLGWAADVAGTVRAKVWLEAKEHEIGKTCKLDLGPVTP